MRHFLGQIVVYCLLALAIGLAVRLVFWGLWESVSPGLRLTADLIIFALLGLAIAAAALGDRPQHQSNRFLWISLVLCFPVTFLIDHDYEALELQRTWGLPVSELRDGGRTGVAASPAILLPRRNDGHYYIDAVIGAQTIEFLVDTGATGVAITYSDAERAGVRLQALDFSIPVQTASGQDFGAPVMIPALTLHGHRFENVQALVMRGGGQSLLGMSILSQFDAVEIRNDRLVLRH